MAYNFFPTTKSEIEKALKAKDKVLTEDLTNLFGYLQKFDKQPLVMDTSKPRQPKIKRELSHKTSIKQITKDVKLKTLKLTDKSWGNGSSGNRGSNNRGLDFETKLIYYLNGWWEGKEEKIPDEYMNAISSLDSTYGLSRSKNLKVLHEGGNNTKRPIQFKDNSITLLNSGSSGFDVGKNVTDVTLKTDTDTIYLSLKLGNTVTFFNVGTKTILTMDDIKNGKIRNASGMRLLKLFGIKEKPFCQTFNEGYSFVDTKANADLTGIRKLLRSGIGYGYHILHLYPVSKPYIKSIRMDKKMMEKATDIGNVTVYYGGIGGSGKRVDILFESSLYKFKINLRDTEGHTGYPTRLMCDFSG
jgi:hypothetical protein